MRLKGGPRFFDLADLRQRHNLKAAGVGQDRPFPTDELVKPAKLGHLLCTGAQHQMIGIAKNNIGPGFLHLIEIKPLDRSHCAHRHECGRANVAAPRVHRTTPSQPVFFMKGKSEFLRHAAGHSRLASP